MSYRESNIIVGCLNKHPNMDVSDFNKNYLNTLLDKMSKENKQVFLGDFSINVPNYNNSQSINELLDSLASNSFIPYTLQPAELLVTQKPSLIIYSVIQFLMKLSLAT